MSISATEPLTGDRRSRLSRLRHTPLVDLLRGRLTGRLDVEHALQRHDLPPPLASIVRTTARRTRLWRAERVDVADELAAHFAEGLAAGATPEALERAFGDQRLAARLIRRSKRRQRSPAWKAARVTGFALIGIVGLYVVATLRLHLARPAPSVDYLAQINVGAAAVPEDERAWPLYREALRALPPREATDRDVYAQRPGDEGWEGALAFVGARREAIARTLAAAARPGLGYVASTTLSAEDRALWPEPDDVSVPPDDTGPMLYHVRLPHLAEIRRLARLLALDARRAAAAGDGDTVVATVAAMVAMAEHVREIPFVIDDLVGFALIHFAVQTAGETLATHGDALEDGHLQALAHHLSGTDRALVARFDGERLGFADLLQHLYTDDGDGDGHLTATGMRMLARADGDPSGPDLETTLLLPLIDAVDVGRARMLATFERLLAAAARDAVRPRWEWEGPVEREVDSWHGSRVDTMRYLPVVLFMPALSKVTQQAEITRAYRDGVLVGIALELHHRRHGAWAEDLMVLTPHLLPEVPRDRVDGRPLRYAIENGTPIVYSVGTDRDDDGGRRVPGRYGYGGDPASRWMAATEVDARHRDPEATQPPDGDWVLWPPRSGEE